MPATALWRQLHTGPQGGEFHCWRKKGMRNNPTIIQFHLREITMSSEVAFLAVDGFRPGQNHNSNNDKEIDHEGRPLTLPHCEREIKNK